MKVSAGDQAPHFFAPDQHGHVRTSEEFRDNWLLLYFYPRDNTPGCTKEACTLRDHYDSLKRLMSVVGVSASGIQSHARFAAKHELPFTLLADPGRRIINAYGANGIPYAKRTSFLIDPSGIIVKVYQKVKPAEHAADLLDEFQDIVDSVWQTTQ